VTAGGNYKWMEDEDGVMRPVTRLSTLLLLLLLLFDLQRHFEKKKKQCCIFSLCQS